MPFNPGNKRAQRARNVPTLGGPMKFGLYPTVGVSLPFLLKLERCCGAKNGCPGDDAPLACGASVKVCAACGVPATCPANAPRGSCVSRADIKAALEPEYTAYCADCCGPVPLDMTSLENALKKALCAQSELAANLKKFADAEADAITEHNAAKAKDGKLTKGEAGDSFAMLRLKVFLQQDKNIAGAKEVYATAAEALVTPDETGLKNVALKLVAFVKAQIEFAEAAPADKKTKKDDMDAAKVTYNNAWKVVYGPKTAGSLPKLAEARDTAIGDAEKNIAKAKLAKNTTEGLKALRALL